MRRLMLAALVVALALLSGCGSFPAASGQDEDVTLTFGDVSVSKAHSEIRFYATVTKDEGWVQHLLYLPGYQWLQEQSAVVSDASLAQLQHAIAVLNETLWDKLWLGTDSDEAFDVEVYLEGEGKRIRANALVASDDEVHVGDMVFLGCPYFDSVAFRTASLADCLPCPVFPLEQRVLQERFTRENGESGYELNTSNMFDPGTTVEVIIRIP